MYGGMFLRAEGISCSGFKNSHICHEHIKLSAAVKNSETEIPHEKNDETNMQYGIAHHVKNIYTMFSFLLNISITNVSLGKENML